MVQEIHITQPWLYPLPLQKKNPDCERKERVKETTRKRYLCINSLLVCSDAPTSFVVVKHIITPRRAFVLSHGTATTAPGSSGHRVAVCACADSRVVGGAAVKRLGLAIRIKTHLRVHLLPSAVNNMYGAWPTSQYVNQSSTGRLFFFQVTSLNFWETFLPIYNNIDKTYIELRLEFCQVNFSTKDRFQEGIGHLTVYTIWLFTHA